MPSRARLYSIALSHPGHAARLMLERKGVDHEVTYLLSGLHALLLRGLGFRRGTTPALRIGGSRIQGSREIAAALDTMRPEPALLPPDADARRTVLDAEEWGERELQPIPRRLMRWGFVNDHELLRWQVVSELHRLGLRRLPASTLVSRAFLPVAAHFARVSGASDMRVRADLHALPALLREVELLMEAGTIGGAEPNAADFQIGTTARALYAFDDLRPLLEGTPAGELGLRILPDLAYRIPPFLPRAWLPA